MAHVDEKAESMGVPPGLSEAEAIERLTRHFARLGLNRVSGTRRLSSAATQGGAAWSAIAASNAPDADACFSGAPYALEVVVTS